MEKCIRRLATSNQEMQLNVVGITRVCIKEERESTDVLSCRNRPVYHMLVLEIMRVP